MKHPCGKTAKPGLKSFFTHGKSCKHQACKARMAVFGALANLHSARLTPENGGN